MDFPEFFKQAPVITLHDPLAVFLGASPSGLFTYSYGDAVKLAGHSCPTVAGTYLMIYHGLRHLYGDAVPRRGSVEVFMQGASDEGTTGVMASVATLITGAAAETGFAGIAGHFRRRDLLHYSADIPATMALRRVDDGADEAKGVLLDLDTSVVPAQAEMRIHLSRVLQGTGNDDDKALFAGMWQDRVKRMLVDHAEDKSLILVKPW